MSFLETDKDHSKNLPGKKSRKQLEDKAVRQIKFPDRKKKRQIKARINRDFWKIVEVEEDNYKPERVGNFWNNDYIKYESNGNKNKPCQSKSTLIRLNHT